MSTMFVFEEGSERCATCQEPKPSNAQMYCSAECRMADDGSIRPKPKPAAVLTAQVPIALSPHLRPINAMHPSPIMPAHGHDAISSSSSSSETSSPLQSPSTNPTGADSPPKASFNIGPPAYPQSSAIHFSSGSVPVKIPIHQTRHVPAPQPTPSNGTVYQGTSIDTLRFGRKPALINSITSPNALIARCACGKPANHASRATSKERMKMAESDFSRLALGSPRIGAKDTASRVLDRRAFSGYGTPQYEPMNVDLGMGSGVGASALSRSRSDPMHPKMYTSRNSNPPAPAQEASPITPTNGRRASHAAVESTRAETRDARESNREESNARDRGRSKDRIRHKVEPTPNGLLNHPPEREPAPSRSRHRRDESERARERERSRRDVLANGPKYSPRLQAVDDHAQIMPSWNKAVGMDDGIAPSLVKNGWRSPRKMEGGR